MREPVDASASDYSDIYLIMLFDVEPLGMIKYDELYQLWRNARFINWMLTPLW